MKQLLIFTFIFQMSFAINARTLKDGHDCGSKGLPPDEKEVGIIERINSGFEKTKLEVLVTSVCSDIMIAHTSPNKQAVKQVGFAIESTILKHLKLTRQSKNFEKSIASFWNKNHNDFICKANLHYGKKHLFKVVVDMQMYTPVLLDYFLKEDQKYKIDVNAYEMINGEPETTLDYLYAIKSGKNSSRAYNMPEINGLIEVLEDEYNALRGKELKL